MKQSWIILLFFAALACCTNKVYAQQTVFNVPNADATEKGHIFLQQESQFRAWNPDAFWLGTHYGAYGIGHNTELDVTLFNVSAPASNNVVLGTGFKSAIPIPKLKDKYPDREYKVTVGTEVLTSLQGQGVGNWTYGTLSGRVPKVNTRLTAGISAGTKDIFGTDTVCFIGAVEQPITEKLGIIADWYSGNEHWSGYLISGVSYKLPKNTAIYAGYQIPNSSKVGPSGFVLEVSKIY